MNQSIGDRIAEATQMQDKAAIVAAEADERREDLRAIHTAIAGCVARLMRLHDRGDGSRELSMARARLEEAGFWVQADGHAGWIER